jgi:hypothetical protein
VRVPGPITLTVVSSRKKAICVNRQKTRRFDVGRAVYQLQAEGKCS